MGVPGLTNFLQSQVARAWIPDDGTNGNNRSNTTAGKMYAETQHLYIDFNCFIHGAVQKAEKEQDFYLGMVRTLHAMLRPFGMDVEMKKSLGRRETAPLQQRSEEDEMRMRKRGDEIFPEFDSRSRSEALTRSQVQKFLSAYEITVKISGKCSLESVSVFLDGACGKAKTIGQRERNRMEQDRLRLALKPRTRIMQNIQTVLEVQTERIDGAMKAMTRSETQSASIRFSISGTDVAGEGEEKLFQQLLRKNCIQKLNHTPSTKAVRNTVIGIDSDLFLGALCPPKDVFLASVTPEISIIYRNPDPAIANGIVDRTSLRKKFAQLCGVKEFQSQWNEDWADWDPKRFGSKEAMATWFEDKVSADIAFLMLLCGNDELPTLILDLKPAFDRYCAIVLRAVKRNAEALVDPEEAAAEQEGEESGYVWIVDWKAGHAGGREEQKGSGRGERAGGTGLGNEEHSAKEEAVTGAAKGDQRVRRKWLNFHSVRLVANSTLRDCVEATMGAYRGQFDEAANPLKLLSEAKSDGQTSQNDPFKVAHDLLCKLPVQDKSTFAQNLYKIQTATIVADPVQIDVPIFDEYLSCLLAVFQKTINCGFDSNECQSAESTFTSACLLRKEVGKLFNKVDFVKWWGVVAKVRRDEGYDYMPYRPKAHDGETGGESAARKDDNVKKGGSHQGRLNRHPDTVNAIVSLTHLVLCTPVNQYEQVMCHRDFLFVEKLRRTGGVKASDSTAKSPAVEFANIVENLERMDTKVEVIERNRECTEIEKKISKAKFELRKVLRGVGDVNDQEFEGKMSRLRVHGDAEIESSDTGVTGREDWETAGVASDFGGETADFARLMGEVLENKKTEHSIKAEAWAEREKNIDIRDVEFPDVFKAVRDHWEDMW